MRLAPPLLTASLLATAACGSLLGLDDKEFDPALAPAGQGGQSEAGAGGQAGLSGSSGQNQGGASGGKAGGGGQGGAGAAGQGGAGQGGAGGAAGAAGQAGGGAAGAAGQGGAGAAGTAGEGGVSGSSGQSGAGQGGCTLDLDCPASPDPCSRAVCLAGQCIAEPDPTYVPSQMMGDCQTRVCQGGQTVSQPDSNDPPAPIGQCGGGSCAGGSPVHADDSTLCAYGFLCQLSSCVCPGCPDGPVPGALADHCRFPLAAVVPLSSGVSVSQLQRIMDGSLSSSWETPDGLGSKTYRFRLELGSPTWFAGLVVYQERSISGFSTAVEYSVEVQQGGTSSGTQSYHTTTTLQPDPAPASIDFLEPLEVSAVEFEVQVMGATGGFRLNEVTFRACP